jgi:hypothetical protein
LIEPVEWRFRVSGAQFEWYREYELTRLKEKSLRRFFYRVNRLPESNGQAIAIVK